LFWCPDFKRAPERVREDVIDGYVSRGAARDSYGVALTDDLDIDRARTARLRG
jgi:N-methylhydantoinase B